MGESATVKSWRLDPAIKVCRSGRKSLGASAAVLDCGSESRPSNQSARSILM